MAFGSLTKNNSPSQATVMETSYASVGQICKAVGMYFTYSILWPHDLYVAKWLLALAQRIL